MRAVYARIRAVDDPDIFLHLRDETEVLEEARALPLPVPRNALDPGIVPGGSSSGSAVAVAQGIVVYAVGTDTAGSGRVPATLNGIVGLKPTLGALSARGVVPPRAGRSTRSQSSR